MRFLFVLTFVALSIFVYCSDEDGALLLREARQFQISEISDWRKLLVKLERDNQSGFNNPAKKIVSLAPNDFIAMVATSIQKKEISEEEKTFVVATLNRVAESSDLYDAESFRGQILPAEARKLIKRGIKSISKDEILKLNHLLIEAYFSLELAQKFTNGAVQSAFNTAYLHLRRGDAKMALKVCDDALEDDPLNFYTRITRAEVLITLGDYVTANNDVDILLRQYPEYEDPYFLKARLFLLEKHNELDDKNDPILLWLHSGDSRKSRAVVSAIRKALTQIRNQKKEAPAQQ